MTCPALAGGRTRPLRRGGRYRARRKRVAPRPCATTPENRSVSPVRRGSPPRHKGEHNVFPTSIHPPDRLKGNLRAHLSPLYASKEERWRYDGDCNDQEGGTGTNQVADRFGSPQQVSVVEWFRFGSTIALEFCAAPDVGRPRRAAGGAHDLRHTRASGMPFALGRAEIMSAASVFESLTSAMPNRPPISRRSPSPPSSLAALRLDRAVDLHNQTRPLSPVMIIFSRHARSMPDHPSYGVRIPYATDTP